MTSIGFSAFSFCQSLTSVKIYNSVTSIGGGAFNYTAWYNNQPDGLVYAGKVAYKYKGTMPSNTKIVLEEGTLGIAAYAFDGCSNLACIDIPNSVTSIGEYAFRGCTGLTSIDIPNSVTNIGQNAFSDTAWENNQPDGIVYAGKIAYKYKGTMFSNTIIVLEDGTLGIAASAFVGFSSLTSVTIPNSVTSIGAFAFEYCSSLMEVKSLIESPYEIEDRVFSYETYQQGTLYIPKGTMSLYTSLDGWRNFQNIVEMSDDDDILNIIHLANANSEKVCVDVEESGIRINNAPEGTLCQVFSTDGKLLKLVKLTTVNHFIGLPGSQMYIVKVGDKTIKVAL